MAIYAVSDVHGHYRTFLNALDTIGFSENDELYIIGDAIDRGPGGVKLLRHIMASPNMRMLMGNHEHMCVEYFSEAPDAAAVRRWNRNRNYPTLKGFDEAGPEEKERVLGFMRALPAEKLLEVNGRRFRLVHGFAGEDVYRKVWNRPGKDTEAPDRDTETLIIGHTPVCEFVCPGPDEDMYVYSHMLTRRGDHFRIFRGNGFIDIDCCLGYGFSAARLGVLRLDDLAEFYEPAAEED